jgi:ferredoxin
MVEIKWLAQVDKDKCIGCSSCENVCPTEAINVVPLESPDEECITPCRLACPAGIDIQGYVAHINRGEFSEALKLIKEKNPLPLSVGRVCPHFCEDACRRTLVDQPIAINPLKRFVADYDQLNGVPFKPQIAPKMRIELLSSEEDQQVFPLPIISGSEAMELLFLRRSPNWEGCSVMASRNIVFLKDLGPGNQGHPGNGSGNQNRSYFWQRY